MKKALLLGLAVLFMFALAGCDDLLNNTVLGNEPDGPKTDGDWDAILNNFEAQTGDEAGEIKYKFKSIDNSNTAVYTLYYLESAVAVNKGDSIIVADQKKDVAPTSNFTTLSGFKPGSTYSMVVVAKKGSDTARSAVLTGVKAKEGDPPLELTVTGIPPLAGIAGASLLDDSLQPVAVAVNIGGKFAFYKYVATANPPMGAAWSTTGSYYIALVNAIDASKVTATYTYIKGKFSFDQTTASLDWALFKDQSQLALMIPDIPAETTIGAARLYETEPAGLSPVAPKAVGVNVGGVFKFTEYTTSSTQGSNFTTVGSYYIYLTANADGTGAVYVYKTDITSSSSSQFSFSTQQTTANIAWSKFVPKS